jgi:hypothetical protein
MSTTRSIEFLFAIGTIVYLLTDPDGFERVVVGYEVDGNLGVKYKIRLADDEPTTHYYYELTENLPLDSPSAN